MLNNRGENLLVRLFSTVIAAGEPSANDRADLNLMAAKSKMLEGINRLYSQIRAAGIRQTGNYLPTIFGGGQFISGSLLYAGTSELSQSKGHSLDRVLTEDSFAVTLAALPNGDMSYIYCAGPRLYEQQYDPCGVRLSPYFTNPLGDVQGKNYAYTSQEEVIEHLFRDIYSRMNDKDRKKIEAYVQNNDGGFQHPEHAMA